MLVSELKKILEVSCMLGKGFAPVTEYTYFNGKDVRATNMEAFLALEVENPMPFNSCILTEKMNKFLTSMDGGTDLTFITNDNTLDITYGKKNKFIIPTQPLADFPDLPSVKYNDHELLCDIQLTEDFIKRLIDASKFISTTDNRFNGVYLKNDKIYSSNREIIYVGDVDAGYENTIFIPYNLIKLLTKFKKTFNILEVYSCGFKATGFGSILYYANYEDNTMPDFDRVISSHKDFFQVTVTEELKNSINRVNLFDEIVNICIKNKVINIISNNINETIDIVDFVSNEEYTFKFNTTYLNKLVDCETISFTQKADDKTISAIKAIGENYKILCAVVL